MQRVLPVSQVRRNKRWLLTKRFVSTVTSEHPKSVLNRWAQDRGWKFAETFQLHTLELSNGFKSQVNLLQPKKKTIQGDKTPVKKDSELSAYKKTLEYIQHQPVQKVETQLTVNSDELYYEAVFGDALLRVLLCMQHEANGSNRTAQLLNEYCEKRENNAVLISKMHRIGLKPSGSPKLDSALVEQVNYLALLPHTILVFLVGL